MRKALQQVFLRSFFVQAGWNFNRLQNLGFAWSMVPALDSLYSDPQKRRAAILRHLELVNTHPYMATLLMGAVIRAEQESVELRIDPAPRVSAIKMGMMGPLAAVGDTLFWATLRPLAALAAAAFAWMAPETSPVVPLLIYLCIFNAPHLLMRYSGLMQGYALGPAAGEYLRRADTRGVIAAFRLAAMILLGAVLAAFGSFHQLASGAPMPFQRNFLFVATGIAMLMALRLKFSVNKVFMGLCLLALVFSLSYYHF